jgi:hypothetical protein
MGEAVRPDLAGQRCMTSAASSPEFIRYVAETYKDDLTGYRQDILGRKPNPATVELEKSIVENKRTAAGTGHGIGKTALGADAIHWFISTRPHPAIVATANTEDQLQKKLWRELNKTNQNAKNRDWFEWKQSSFTMFNDPTAQANALAWSENNPDAFAGTHEMHVLGVFDEASAIARSIFNSFAGAMTTAGARWLLLGNSTRSEGYFYDAVHGKLKARKPGDTKRGMWSSYVIPSFASPFVEKSWVEEMKLTLGEDSDEYRIRVLGLPPRTDSQQFIPREMVTSAMDRRIDTFARWPLILGCDVGRGDRSVMLPRRGRKVLPNVQVFTGERTMDFAQRIANEIRFYRDEHDLKAQVILEELGMGVGVVETLEDMGYADQVWGVNTGASPSEGGKRIVFEPPLRNVGRVPDVARRQCRASEYAGPARRPRGHQAQAQRERQAAARNQGRDAAPRRALARPWRRARAHVRSPVRSAPRPPFLA